MAGMSSVARPDVGPDRMSSISVTTDADNPQDVSSPTVQGSASWVVSLLFWLTLLSAAVLFALVALAPKLAEWMKVREQYVQNAGRLVALEGQVEYLERVAAALESDPEFARRLAQASQPERSAHQQMIPVTKDLVFGGSERQHDIERAPQPLYSGLIIRLASDQAHRRVFLCAAALLIIFGFTFLNDSERGCLRVLGRCVLAVVSFPVRRYRSLSGANEAASRYPESNPTAAAESEELAG